MKANQSMVNASSWQLTRKESIWIDRYLNKKIKSFDQLGEKKREYIKSERDCLFATFLNNTTFILIRCPVSEWLCFIRNVFLSRNSWAFTMMMMVIFSPKTKSFQPEDWLRDDDDDDFSVNGHMRGHHHSPLFFVLLRILYFEHGSCLTQRNLWNKRTYYERQ